MLVIMAMVLSACQSDNLILTKKDMQFVGQFNKGFSYEVLGFGPLLRKLTFSHDDLVALVREKIPQAAALEDIFVIDVGFKVNPRDDHQAQYLDIKLSADSSQTTTVFSIDDLFIDGNLIIDPAQLNLGDDYEEMLRQLNQMIQSGSLNEYILDLILNPRGTDEMTHLDLDIIFSFKFSFRACVDVPAGTHAKDCE